MPYDVQWSASAGEDIDALFDYLAERASLWAAVDECERLIRTTDKLAEFPRLYEVAPQYGQGVRRISQQSQNVLYEVDDQAQVVRVLAVVGQRQQPRKIR
jgi:plasmid stabilization system protein ParE